MHALGKQRLVRMAEEYRQHWHRPAHGVIFIWQNKAYAWRSILGEPQTERPGVIAVDEYNHFFIATGGNAMDGAKQWEKLSLY